MSDHPSSFNGANRRRPPVREDAAVSAEEFQASFGEDIRRTLNLETWRVGSDLSEEFERVDREVRHAVEKETDLHRKIRIHVFPKLALAHSAPKGAGVHTADRELIARIHDEFLFNGSIEACDGISQVYDTLPLTIYQIGVSLVSYQGNQGSWGQRLFRKDLQQKYPDPVAEAIAILERRQQRGDERSNVLGELAQKAIMDYAERAILLHRSTGCWRMGDGNPVTYELLTGGGNLELMVEATKVLRDLVEVHEKFIFVGHEPRERMLLTIAQALRPMEFAIVSTLDERLEDWLHQNRFAVQLRKLQWGNESISSTEWIPRFIRDVASKIVIGLFRASAVAPAQMFYAHVDHADYAAHMVLADSMLAEHKGRSLLTELARHGCQSLFGDSLEALTSTAFAAAGAPWRFAND